MTPRRSRPNDDPERLRKELVELLNNFESKLKLDDHLREKVQALIPAFQKLRDLGSSLIPYNHDIRSGRNRILKYLQTYPQQVISGEELMVVAGIDDWARRVRELRHELGWNIISGDTARVLLREEGDVFDNDDLPLADMRTDDYMLVAEEQDRDAAHRFHVANSIRKQQTSVKSKILQYLKENVGRPVSGEELSYLAKGKTEWARRVRELRTEDGWQVKTRFTGRPDLPSTMYVLENLEQLPEHDRHISEYDQKQALVRDNHSCQAHKVGLSECGWNHARGKETGDNRFLELHHVQHHLHGGSNEVENLVTLCNVCHDEVHRNERE